MTLALVPIDIQQGLDDEAYYGGRRNNPAFEENVARLLGAARTVGAAIVHLKHNSTEPQSPLRPGHPGNAFKPEAEPQPGEPVFEKTVNSGFIGTDLEARLRAAGVTEIMAFGLTTEHCVSTTVRMAGNLGFRVCLVGDACAAFPKVAPDGRRLDAELVHDTHLASLHGEFADVITTHAAITRLTAKES